MGAASALREALLDAMDRLDQNSARTLVRRLGPDGAPSAQAVVQIGGGMGGLVPKDVSWSIEHPVDPETSKYYDMLFAVRDAISRNAGQPQPGTNALYQKRDAIYTAMADAERAARPALNRRYAVPAFKAAEGALKDDMDARSPFELWSPASGYSFFGITPTHDAIYSRMVARNQHPDYYVQTNGHDVYLRRRFPFRHEVAAGAALGALSPDDTSDDSLGG